MYNHKYGVQVDILPLNSFYTWYMVTIEFTHQHKHQQTKKWVKLFQCEIIERARARTYTQSQIKIKTTIRKCIIIHGVLAYTS